MHHHVMMWPYGISYANRRYMQAYGIPIVGRYTQCLDEYAMPVLEGSQRVVDCLS